MTAVEIEQFRERMEEYLQRVAAGDTVVLLREGVPVAELHRPVTLPLPMAQRPIGLAQGMGTIPPTFFDPLPNDLLALFSGEEPSRQAP